MHQKIIKPLIIELKVKDELNRRMSAEHDINVRDLKQLNTIIRIPNLCLQFQNALRNRREAKRLTSYQKQALKQLVEWRVTDENS